MLLVTIWEQGFRNECMVKYELSFYSLPVSLHVKFSLEEISCYLLLH